MIRKTRVLVVDDSVVIRRLVTDALNADPAMEVVGVAANGLIALAKIPQLRPDLVTLDVEMPDMDGLQTLVEIRKSYPRLPVIMFSTVTSRGASATLDALAHGANDYVTKPANVGSVSEAMHRLRDELIPKIKHFCGNHLPMEPIVPKLIKTTPAPVIVKPAIPAAPPSRVDVVVIGVSTGGPDALSKIIPAIPAELPVPILIVQHMPPIFTKLLAERLNTISAIGVKEAEPGDVISPGMAWIAPGDFHMSVAALEDRMILKMDKMPHENSCRPSVDVLFRAAAKIYGPRVLAVILTGMGQDGLRGTEVICKAGGHAIAQDEATSVVWGMPGFIVRSGFASGVLPLSQIPREIVNRVQVGRSLHAV